MAVAGLISEQSECYASLSTAVIPVMTAVPRNARPSVARERSFECVVFTGFGTSSNCSKMAAAACGS